MARDLRDPVAVGDKLLELRLKHPDIDICKLADLDGLDAPDWTGDGMMSNDPALHHSKTPQDHLIEFTGGV